VQMTNLQANVMLIALPLIVSMLTFPLWGRLVDRLGCRPVLLIAGIFIVHGGASWIFVTKESWWIGYIGALLAMMAWPGVELANLNILLRISQSRDDLHIHRGSAFVAMHSLVVALGGTLSGLFGGAVAQVLRDWQGTIFGWPLTYHGLLLLISAGLRAGSLVWLIGMHEPQAYTTRAALRYMVTNIYSNVQQAVLIPVRGMGRLGRLTYRLPPVGRMRRSR
jgi:MFS family permease